MVWEEAYAPMVWLVCTGADICTDPLLKPTVAAPSPSNDNERASRVVEDDWVVLPTAYSPMLWLVCAAAEIVMVFDDWLIVTLLPPARTIVPDENEANVPDVFPDALTMFAIASIVMFEPADDSVTMFPWVIDENAGPDIPIVFDD